MSPGWKRRVLEGRSLLFPSLCMCLGHAVTISLHHSLHSIFREVENWTHILDHGPDNAIIWLAPCPSSSPPGHFPLTACCGRTATAADEGARCMLVLVGSALTHGSSGIVAFGGWHPNVTPPLRLHELPRLADHEVVHSRSLGGAPRVLCSTASPSSAFRGVGVGKQMHLRAMTMAISLCLSFRPTDVDWLVPVWS